MTKKTFQIIKAEEKAPRLFMNGERVMSSDKTYELSFYYEESFYTAQFHQKERDCFVDSMTHFEHPKSDTICFLCRTCMQHKTKREELTALIINDPKLRLKLLM